MSRLLPLAGKTIALPETRQLEELAQLLEREGAATLRCPLVGIVNNPDVRPVVVWIEELAAGRMDYLVLMTGEALRRLGGFAERANMKDQFVAALSRVRKITRGPKPVQALREIGLQPDLIAETPTTAGIIAGLAKESLQGKTVGVTLYGEPNRKLVESLESAGAVVKTVMPYLYAPASDMEKVADLIVKMADGEIDAIAFTSSPQVDRLWEAAKQRKLEAELGDGLKKTKVAAVGPVVAETLLKEHGIRADICPERGFVMKNLVQLIVRALSKPI